MPDHLHGTRRAPQTVYVGPFAWWWIAFETMQFITAVNSVPRHPSRK